MTQQTTRHDDRKHSMPTTWKTTLKYLQYLTRKWWKSWMAAMHYFQPRRWIIWTRRGKLELNILQVKEGGLLIWLRSRFWCWMNNVSSRIRERENWKERALHFVVCRRCPVFHKRALLTTRESLEFKWNPCTILLRREWWASLASSYKIFTGRRTLNLLYNCNHKSWSTTKHGSQENEIPIPLFNPGVYIL